MVGLLAPFDLHLLLLSLPARVAPTRVFSVLPHVRDKHWLLVDEQVDEATEHGHCIINARIGGLAEKVR